MGRSEFSSADERDASDLTDFADGTESSRISNTRLIVLVVGMFLAGAVLLWLTVRGPKDHGNAATAVGPAESRGLAAPAKATPAPPTGTAPKQPEAAVQPTPSPASAGVPPSQTTVATGGTSDSTAVVDARVLSRIQADIARMNQLLDTRTSNIVPRQWWFVLMSLLALTFALAGTTVILVWTLLRSGLPQHLRQQRESLDALSAELQAIRSGLRSLEDARQQASSEAAERREMLGRVTAVGGMRAGEDPYRVIEIAEQTKTGDKLPPDVRLVARYNAARQDEEAQAEFRRAFQGEYLGTMNAEERSRAPGTPALFGRADGGDFYAFRTDPAKEEFQVVPRFGRALNRERFDAGAWNVVFCCQQYDPEKPSQDIELSKSATFERRGEQWAVREQGVIRTL